jgi:hypothetical protein
LGLCLDMVTAIKNFGEPSVLSHSLQFRHTLNAVNSGPQMATRNGPGRKSFTSIRDDAIGASPRLISSALEIFLHSRLA